ncbi:MAG: MBL fold metallo-hydrolase [Anaerolineales bacterium]
MDIGFYGAAQTVTGSRHLLVVNGHRLLLDCGLYQGHRKDSYEVNQNFQFSPKDVDAVILSHAHIDHSGNLPNLVGQGYDGPIYATHATKHLADIMLRDSGHIQEEDAVYLNKKRARHNEPPIDPLYTGADAARATRQLVGRDYAQPFEPIPGVTATLVDAGHILGSAGVVLDIDEDNQHKRLMFSGDIGRPDVPLLRDPVLPNHVDYLIMECTYGDRPHDPPEQAHQALLEAVSRTIKRGGRVIVPAFAVGRTQMLVYSLHQMIEHGQIPSIPVFVDSPLAINATTVFREHPECFDQETREFIRNDPHGAALGFDLLQYTLTVAESKAINDVRGPVVILSASGMAEVGRILHHLKNNIEDPANTILITSWMAPHTLGRRLAEGEPKVRIFGKEYDVNAEVVEIDGFSAHAGQQFLETYALASRETLKQIYLVHGEQGAADALMGKLAERGFDAVLFPELGVHATV